MERDGGVAGYPIAYVIGSGGHAARYLIQVTDPLFQSPIFYYAGRHAYSLCPGYEQVSEPDFTRAVGAECVLCHSGRPRHVPATKNPYKQPVVLEEEISCERWHGAAEEHLRRPVQGSIINSAKLTGPARDSICEQCHLAGVTQRILNPSKEFDDFRPASDWKMCLPSTPARVC